MFFNYFHQFSILAVYKNYRNKLRSKIIKIKKIILRNDYKRFHNLTIDLGEKPPRIVALVGPNGCGKSSVFDAMLYVSSHYFRLGKFEQKPGPFHSMLGKEQFYHQNLHIVFEEEEYSKLSHPKRSTIFSFRSSHRYNSSLKVKKQEALLDIGQNRYGASTSVDLDDKIVPNYQGLLIKYHSYLESEDCKPSEAKEKIIGDLNRAIERCLDLKISNLGDILAGKGTLYFAKPDQAKEFEYDVLSSGEKEVVDILLDIYLRQEVYNDTIYIIDEPELHINTCIQRQLLVEINKFVPENCQIWIATHSIGFLRALQDELGGISAVIEFKAGKNYGSESCTLLPISKTRKNWQRIFETALEDLTGLLAPKKIIYCEGRPDPTVANEEQGLDAEVYNQVFSKTHPDTLFISSGGGGEVTNNASLALKVFSKAFLYVCLYLLKDRDEVSDEERNDFLDKDPKNRMLKRREIENYLFDKEVVEFYCVQKSHNFDNEEYDRYVTDITMQNLKIVQQKIQQICGYRGNAKGFKVELGKCILPETSVYKELKEIIFS